MAFKMFRRSILLVVRGQATIHRDHPVSKPLHRGGCSKTRCQMQCPWPRFHLRKLPSRLALACQHPLGHHCQHGTQRPSRLHHNGKYQSLPLRQLRVTRQQWLQWFIRSNSSSSMHRTQVQLGQQLPTNTNGVGSRTCQGTLRCLGKFHKMCIGRPVPLTQLDFALPRLQLQGIPARLMPMVPTL